MHSPDEIPYVNTEPYSLRATDAHRYLSFSTMEMHNTKEVQDQTIEQRKCRFPQERLEDSVQPYSFASCMTDLRIKLEFQYCNCTATMGPFECMCEYCTLLLNYNQFFFFEFL